MELDEIAVKMGKIGPGQWELRTEDGHTVDAVLDDVEVSEERGFRAEGRNEDRAMLYELTTGTQPGGPVRLRRRPLDGDEFTEVGALTEAIKRD